MSDDTYTEVTNTSVFSRLSSSIKGIFFGFILLIVAIVLLWWNEGRSVKRYRALQEGRSSAISIDSKTVDAAHQNKLVHLGGQTATNETLEDKIFGVQAEEVKLIRIVEMYQWDESKKTETKKKLGGGEEKITKYSYNKKWSERLINSSSFKKSSEYKNPTTMEYKGQSFTAKQVMIDEFKLSNSLVNMMSNRKNFTQDFEETLPDNLKDKVQVTGYGFYKGNQPNSPEIGDLKISYKIIPNAVVTLVAKQTKNSFAPYSTSGGGSIELLEMGNHSLEQMFDIAENDNFIMTWAIRGGGILIMFFGFSLIVSPLNVLADIVPFIGNIVDHITGFFCFIMAAGLSFFIIAIAWIAHRPMIAIPLLAVTGVCIGFIVKKLWFSKPKATLKPAPKRKVVKTEEKASTKPTAKRTKKRVAPKTKSESEDTPRKPVKAKAKPKPKKKVEDDDDAFMI